MEMLEFQCCCCWRRCLFPPCCVRGHPARVAAAGADRVGRRHHLVGRRAVDVAIDPELFLVLFIAPLLFDESRHASKRGLWDNKGAIVSLAVGLVLATVLVVGFVAKLARALPSRLRRRSPWVGVGATDAVAVSALARISACPAVRNPCSPARRSSTTHRASCRSSSP